MVRKFLLIAAFVCSPLTANAVPILYNTTYTATTGPSGTGSFLYDDGTGVLSGFNWIFSGGISGGTVPLTALAFEILSETEAAPFANCINTTICGVVVGSLQGAAPGGASELQIASTTAVGSSAYLFVAAGGQTVAQGTISTARAQVPEPTTLSLFGLGVLAFGFIRRRALDRRAATS